MSNDTLIDLDNIEDVSLGGVEAAPEFIEPPMGRYKLGTQAKIEEYEENEKDEDGNATGEKKKAKRIRITYDIQGTLELKNKKDLVPQDGSLFSETFKANAEGLRYFKTRAQSILGDLGQSTIKEVVNELNNEAVSVVAEVKVVTTTGKDADGNKREYSNVRIRVISENQQATIAK